MRATDTQRSNALAVFLIIAISVALPESATRAADVTYADIAPLLQQRCSMCHSGAAAPRGLRLDSLDAIKAGSERGAVVTPGDPQNSELIRRLNGTSVPRMPMTGPPFLADAEIELFEQWIAAGIPAGTPLADQPVDVAVVEETAAASTVTFDKVAAIFATRCAKCHTDNGLMGDPPEGYRLTSYESIVSARDRVRVIPGNAAASELMRRIRGQARPRMPFDGPPYLSDVEIAVIEQWIVDGARNSAGEAAPIPVGARVRLHGELQGRWRFDDLPLNITSETRMDKNPRAGDQVRVRGIVQADGSIRADRVSAR